MNCHCANASLSSVLAKIFGLNQKRTKKRLQNFFQDFHPLQKFLYPSLFTVVVYALYCISDLLQVYC